MNECGDKDCRGEGGGVKCLGHGEGAGHWAGLMKMLVLHNNDNYAGKLKCQIFGVVFVSSHASCLCLLTLSYLKRLPNIDAPLGLKGFPPLFRTKINSHFKGALISQFHLYMFSLC